MTEKRTPKVTVRNRGADVQESLESGHIGLDDAAAIIKRRLEGGNPFSAGGSREIKLKVPGMICRWFNSAKSPDHIWRTKHEMGWQPVVDTMLAEPDQLGGYETQGGNVVRGERGAEHLMYMKAEDYALIQRKKTEANEASFGSSKKTKADIVRAAESALGEQAADFIEGNVFGEVTDMTETRTLGQDESIPE